MADNSNRPIIIKRKKIIAAGHHGGAWKVAYADFVTAMMAFFLLMWLLNATTEVQRKGIADYFAPTIAINRISGGGDGMFGGTSIVDQEVLPQTESGQAESVPVAGTLDGADVVAAEVAALEIVERTLLGMGGESLVQTEALRHVITRVTDEGLIIEIFAREGAPLFINDGIEPAPVLVELTAMFARVFAIVTNPVAIDAHTRGRPLVVASHPVWDISTGRAQTVRELLDSGGLDAQRMARITGHADRDPAAKDTLSVRNNRIEIMLLRVEN